MTANDHLNMIDKNNEKYGCFDSIYFKTSDGVTFGCNARAQSAYESATYNNPAATSPKVLSLSGELDMFSLYGVSDCQLYCTGIFTKDCSSQHDDFISVKLAAV